MMKYPKLTDLDFQDTLASIVKKWEDDGGWFGPLEPITFKAAEPLLEGDLVFLDADGLATKFPAKFKWNFAAAMPVIQNPAWVSVQLTDDYSIGWVDRALRQHELDDPVKPQNLYPDDPNGK